MKSEVTWFTKGLHTKITFGFRGVKCGLGSGLKIHELDLG